MTFRSSKRTRRTYWRAWYRKNREAYNEQARKRYHSKRRHTKAVEWRSQYEKQRRAKVRAELLAVLGGECKHCGNNDERVLQVDHVKGGGHIEILRRGGANRNYFQQVIKHVKRGGKRYQLLCANCNWIKRRVNNEVPSGQLYSKRPAMRRKR